MLVHNSKSWYSRVQVQLSTNNLAEDNFIHVLAPDRILVPKLCQNIYLVVVASAWGCMYVDSNECNENHLCRKKCVTKVDFQNSKLQHKNAEYG